MSSQTTALNSGNQAHIKTDVSRIFVGRNRYTKARYNNSAYGSVELLAGTVMGRVKVTGWIKPHTSGASDGSEYPIGVLAEDITVAGGGLVDLFICTEGDVVADKLIFTTSTDNIDKTVGDRRVRDWFQVGGIKLITENSELSAYDNE